MVLFHKLRDIPYNPLDEDSNDIHQSTFYIEYEILGVKQRYKCDFSDLKLQNEEESTFEIDLNRMRIFYFFS